MKIIDVKVEVIHIPMKKPFRIAFAVQDHSVNVLVKVMTDEGIYGIGEAAPFEPVTGENSATVLEVLKLFKQGLIGMDPMNIEGIHLLIQKIRDQFTGSFFRSSHLLNQFLRSGLIRFLKILFKIIHGVVIILFRKLSQIFV